MICPNDIPTYSHLFPSFTIYLSVYLSIYLSIVHPQPQLAPLPQVSASDSGAAEAPKMAEEAKHMFASLGRLGLEPFAWDFPWFFRDFLVLSCVIPMLFLCFSMVSWCFCC